jgi:hypothetical protein
MAYGCKSLFRFTVLLPISSKLWCPFRGYIFVYAEQVAETSMSQQHYPNDVGLFPAGIGDHLLSCMIVNGSGSTGAYENSGPMAC